MVNVVTIDFDIIMAPSIESYNHWIDENCFIDDIVNDFPFFNDAMADLDIYTHLTKFILRACKIMPTENVHFIFDHQRVLDCVANIDDKINLINIDHHHDLGYAVENWNLPVEGVGCGNWVKRMYEIKDINSYIWIRNTTSDSNYPPEDAERKFLTDTFFIQDWYEDLEKIAEVTDVLIICASFSWVPERYRGLFYNWKTMCEEVLGLEDGELKLEEFEMENL